MRTQPGGIFVECITDCTAARAAAREAEGFSLNCSTSVVLGGQSRRGARADCGAYDGAYGGAGS